MDIPSWARVGAKIVYVDDDSNDWYDLQRLSVGAVYTIRKVASDGYNAGVHLTEVVNPMTPVCDGPVTERYYDLAQFRPLVTEADDVALFQRLVADMPISERLDRLAEKLNEEATP